MMLLLFILFFITQIFSEIVQVQVLSRHCDRAPFFPKSIPNDPVNWREVLGIDFQTLTSHGEHQCNLIGKKLRKRYLNQDSPSTFIKDIDTHFHNFDYHFQAGDTNRTIRTCFVISQGLFPIGTGSIDDLTGKCSLDNCTQSIPIHVKKYENDPELEGYWICDKIPNQLFEDVKKTDKWKTFEKKYWDRHIEFIRKLGFNESDGLDDLTEWPTIFDIVNVQHLHNQLNMSKLGITNDDLDFMNTLHDLVRSTQYSRSNVGNLGGSELMRNVLSNMQDVAKRNMDGRYKYVQNCAHDLTVMSTLAALDLIDNYEELQVNPGYGATIIFELHYDKDIKYYVEIWYLPSYEAEDFIKYDLPDCIENDFCSFSDFEKILLEKSINDDWCLNCNQKTADICIKQENSFLKKQVLVNWIVISVLAAAVALLMITNCLMLCKVITGSNKKHNREYEKIQ